MERKVKNIIRIISLLILSAGWSGSCHDPVDDKIPSGDGSVDVTFSLQMPSTDGTAPDTYAVSDADENHVADIDILAFRPDANVPSQWAYAYRAQVSGTDIRDKGTYNTKEFNVKLAYGTEQQNIVVLANARSQVDALTLTAGADRDRLLKQLSVRNSGRWEAKLETGDTGPFTPFPMWGEATQVVTPATQQITGVSLLRSLVRVDVALGGTVSNFVLNKVFIYNSKDSCRIVPDRDKLAANGKSVTAATVPAGSDNNPPLEYDIPAGATIFERSIFMSEAAGPPADQPGEATCIVLGGTYAGVTGYYRVDLFLKDGSGNTTGYRDFLRNYRYRVTVTDVSGPGHSTPGEAFNAKAINITAEITDWDDGGIGFIIFDEQYALSIGPAGFVFGSDALAAEGADNRLQLFTDYPTGWAIESITDAATGDPVTWIDVMQNAAPSHTGPAGTKGIRWMKLSQNIGRERAAVIKLKAGRMSYGLQVTQAEHPGIVQSLSNSYIVAPGSAPVLIPVARANEAVPGSVTGAFTTDIVWYDADDVIASVDPSGTGAAGYVKVFPGAGQGNALVAAKVNGVIVWSWHIWVTGYNPDPPTASNSWTYNGYTFMDRNLGATDNTFSDASRGLFYQWGRKDPIPATNIAGFSTAQGPVTQQVANQNPDKFYYNASYPRDWLSTPDNNLWGHNSTKSIYDPCPEGWRVPSYMNGIFPWSGLSTINFTWKGSGRQFETTAVACYPASGYHDYSNGSLIYVGSSGLYWSASTYSTYAYNLHFGSGTLALGNGSNRTNSGSVRCARYTILNVDKTNLNLGYGALNADDGVNRLTINTDNASGWTVKSIKDATTGADVTWLDVMPSRSGPTATSTRWISVTQNTGAERSAIITLEAGSMNSQITVTQEKVVSNCYMVAPGSQMLRIPVDRAISHGGMGSTASFTAAKLWDDNNVVASVGVEGSGATGYITVTVNNANRQGNALVALKANGVICWSWHIWVTTFNPDPSTTSNSWTYNGYTFMDRNLGATANDFSVAARGLFFQWGRKDPIPATDNVSGFSIAQGPVDQTTAHRNPDKFYKGTSARSYNWLTSQNDNLWGHNAAKSVYDPCPAGWRVPSFKNNVSPWSGLTTNNFRWQGSGTNTGCQYTASVATSRYPASSYRHSTTGLLTNIGGQGDYWSASPDGANAYILYFISSGVYPAYYAYRSLGTAVRCVRE